MCGVWSFPLLNLTFPSQYYRQLAPLSDIMAENMPGGNLAAAGQEHRRTVGLRPVGSELGTESQVSYRDGPKIKTFHISC